ncbi:MAG: J domain-containing protein [Christensenellaceae bacterium]
MNREYYDLLGLNEDATDEEIKERYGELKKKYNEDRWLDGEAGNEAARMLNKLDGLYGNYVGAARAVEKYGGQGRLSGNRGSFENRQALRGAVPSRRV